MDNSNPVDEVQAGAVPGFIELLSNESMQEQAVVALRKYIGEGPQNRDYCLQLGILEHLHASISSKPSFEFLKNVAMIIKHICYSNEPSQHRRSVKAIRPELDTNVLLDVARLLSRLTEGDYEHIQIVIDSQVVPLVVSLLGHSDKRVQTTALRAVGNIATGTNEHTQVLLDCGVLSHLQTLFSYGDNKINREVMWILSNILTEYPQQVQAVIDADLFPAIITSLQQENNKTHKEAAWAVSNALESSKPSQIDYIVKCGVLAPYCGVLDCGGASLIQVVLDGINKILEKAGDGTEAVGRQIIDCGGLSKIQQLQNDENENIRRVAQEIMNIFVRLNLQDLAI